jgi:rod shape-determining protein MreD
MTQRRIVSQHHYASPLPLRLFPSSALLLLVILSLMHLPIPFVNVTNPAFMVMGVFYFTLWQPRYLPHAVVFCCGLLYDAFQSTLFGTHALLLLSLRIAVARVRQKTGFVESIPQNWGYFVLMAIPYLLVEWTVASMQLGDFMPNRALIERDVLTLALYPILYLLLSTIIGKLQSL